MLKNTGYGLLSNPLTAASLGLMAAGGPSPMPVSFGQALNEGLLAGRKAHQDNVELGLLQDKRDMDAELNRWRIKEIQADIANPGAKHGGDLGLIRMLSDPNATEEQRKLAQQALAADLPASVREWEYIQGLKPAEQQQYIAIKRANRYYNIGGSHVLPNPLLPGQAHLAQIDNTLQPGQRPGLRGQVVTREQQAKLRAQLDATQPRLQSGLRAMVAKTRNMLRAIRQARTTINTHDVTGWSSLRKHLPGSPARDLDNDLDTIRTNVSFTELANMKANSPTGSALGSVQVRELEMLEGVIAKLDQTGSKEALLRNLEQIELQGRAAMENAIRAYAADFPPGKYGNPLSNGNDGWSAERED